VEGSCEQGDEPSGLMKCEGFLHRLRNDSNPCNKSVSYLLNLPRIIFSFSANTANI
jgi:hypothetical protein